MTTVLEEVTEQKLDADHVRRRVDDWEERLNDLYATIESWLPDGWTAGKGRPVLMHAELMREFQVAPRQLPTLELAERIRGACQTRAAWIVDRWRQWPGGPETRWPPLPDRGPGRKLRTTGLAGSSGRPAA